ncbi:MULTISPECIES: hydroxyacylglutathione hydrolase [unclassified Sporosarcina]|uniref:hydroxyacylglutathione hydrolase n=1 Tax=unclassified Sporosarcina TaxID=2647733 RepID=UPI000C170EFC|nr:MULTISPECIES: hydroxyacylglutathione hydrolase [unclassified Sporosarcina]PID05977.1 hydroxyacylglutathione hydrolase [Sporosarcina sp. P30]PID09171.1 hydroxyacylglutathione hydrolase [Sporosarcina sp. P31]PID12469.1 hydroxyacylglutathione hydrolase [Sporosarcina sp. P32b]
MIIHPIKAFSDNYIWCIQEETEVVVVDPGKASVVLEYLEEKQLRLAAILLTHMHEDHTGGVREILASHPEILVYGPEETKDLVNSVVKEGDSFNLMSQTFQVYESGGHTHGHISFLMGKNLFCGDALFSAGCGRVFTGDYEAQYETLQKFKHLDDDINVYAGHEYTETNLRFAYEIQPDNKKISNSLDEVQEMRAKGQPTLPSTIGREKEINLFLQAETLEDFIELRNARDNF